jgi:hypothetical protein
VSGGLNKLNGGSSMTLSGAVYFPTQEVEFNGNNSSGSNCTMVVALLVSFTGNSTFDDTGCEAAGVKPIQVSGVEITE